MTKICSHSILSCTTYNILQQVFFCLFFNSSHPLDVTQSLSQKLYCEVTPLWSLWGFYCCKYLALRIALRNSHVAQPIVSEPSMTSLTEFKRPQACALQKRFLE